MAVWEEKRLGEVAEINPNIKLIKNTLYPHIDINQINSLYRYVYSHAEQFYTGQSCSKYCNKDIVFSRITPCLENRKIAQVKIADELGIGSTEFIIFRGKDEYINQSYLYYLLISDNVVLPAINSMSGASGRQRADRNFIKNIKIKIPDLDTQEKIADILSTYDDLIENNNRRIEILEQMAQEIYKEWFVRFRFPEHEKVKFINGLPEGWEVKKIKDIVNRKPFGTLYKESQVSAEGNVIIIDQSRNEFIGFHNNEPDHNADIENPIILFGDHSCKYKLMIKQFSLAENVIPFISNDEKLLTTYYLFYSIYGIVQTTEYKRHWTELVNKKIILADINLQLKFVEQIQDFIKEIENLSNKNQNLIKQRDLLLPRLMSGKLEV